MEWDIVIATSAVIVAIVSCSISMQNYRKSKRLLRHQERITNQLARRDFLIKELKEMMADIDEYEGNNGQAMECPACKEVALKKGAIVDGLQEYNCLECGHVEY